jgi:hypothetical protein
MTTQRRPLEFTPYVGIGPFVFGANRQKISKAAGEPDAFEIDDIMKETREERGKLVLTYRGPLDAMRQVNRLRRVEILKGARVVLDGIDLMHEAELIQKLSARDQRTVKADPYMLFPTLGLCVGGFGRKIPEGKLVIAFAREALEEQERFVENW